MVLNEMIKLVGFLSYCLRNFLASQIRVVGILNGADLKCTALSHDIVGNIRSKIRV